MCYVGNVTPRVSKLQSENLESGDALSVLPRSKAADLIFSMLFLKTLLLKIMGAFCLENACLATSLPFL